jgi:selenocysteine-specific elongation factor
VTDAIPPGRRAKPFPEAAATDVQRLRWMLEEAGGAGVPRALLAQRLGLRPAPLDRVVKELGRVTPIGDVLFAAPVLDRLRGALLAAVDQHHEAQPLSRGIDRQTVRGTLASNDALADEVIRRAERAGVIVVEGAIVRRPGFAAGSAADARTARDRVLERLRTAGVEPPSLTELKAEFGGEVVPLLKLLEQDGRVVAVALEWWFAREAVVELLRRLRGSVRVGERYTPSELREGMGLTRKWLIPFLEWCDRRGLARRVESGRIFREVPGEP